MLDWGKVRFFWSEVAQNFTRNVTMTVTAMGTVAVTIIVLGAFLFAREAFNTVMHKVVGQVVVAAYLKDETTLQQAGVLITQMRADPRVDSVQFVSKAQALASLRKRLRGQVNLDVINKNPLPNALIVHTRDPADVPAVAATLRARPEIALVNYHSATFDKMMKAANVLSIVGVGIIALLLAATALIIYNTIRLTVFARQREINIMQLVGATRWTIRWPFVFEGTLSGLIGAGLGIALLSVGYRSLAPKIVLNLPFLPLKFDAVPLGHIAFELLLAGAIIGMLASLVSVSRVLSTT